MKNLFFNLSIIVFTAILFINAPQAQAGRCYYGTICDGTVAPQTTCIACIAAGNSWMQNNGLCVPFDGFDCNGNPTGVTASSDCMPPVGSVYDHLGCDLYPTGPTISFCNS